jgi:hypothetical protein
VQSISLVKSPFNPTKKALCLLNPTEEEFKIITKTVANPTTAGTSTSATSASTPPPVISTASGSMETPAPSEPEITEEELTN